MLCWWQIRKAGPGRRPWRPTLPDILRIGARGSPFATLTGSSPHCAGWHSATRRRRRCTGYFAGNQILLSLPHDADWAVLDAPAGLQGYKLSDYLRTVDKLIVPLVPSVFDMAATEDFLNAIRSDLRGRRGTIGIVAMRVNPRTKAAAMLEEYLKHFDIPIVAYLRHTQNYVNAAAAGLSIFDPPRTRNKRDVEQWEGLVSWLQAR